jgi:hypothetical protein
MGVSPREIEVRIEELVLDGVSRVDAPRVGMSLERELTRLLALRGVPNGIARVSGLDTLDAGAFTRGLSTTCRELGGEIAQAVYGGLQR